MPFKSESQRRWMHANEPEMAKKWEKETPKDKGLPKKAQVTGAQLQRDAQKYTGWRRRGGYGLFGGQPFNPEWGSGLFPMAHRQQYAPHIPRQKWAAAFMSLAEDNAFVLPAAFADELAKTAKYLNDQIDKPKTKPVIAAPPNKTFKVKQGMNPYSIENTGMDPRQKLLKSQKVGKPADYKQPKLKPLNIKVGFQTSQYSGAMGPVLGPRQHSMIPPFVMPNVKTGGPPSEEKDDDKKKEAEKLSPEQKVEFKRLMRVEGKGKKEQGAQRGRAGLIGLIPGTVAGTVGREFAMRNLRQGIARGAFRGPASVTLALPAAIVARTMPYGGAVGGFIGGAEAARAYQKYKERKKEAATPAGMLASAQKIGKPKTTAPPGPSIAQVSKPVGFGRPAPGAKKGNEII